MLRWRGGATGAMSIGLLGLGDGVSVSVSGDGFRVTGNCLVRGGAGSVSLGLGRNGLDLRDVGDDGGALLEKLALPLGERLSSLGLASGLVALDETVSGGIRDLEG